MNRMQHQPEARGAMRRLQRAAARPSRKNGALAPRRGAGAARRERRGTTTRTETCNTRAVRRVSSHEKHGRRRSRDLVVSGTVYGSVCISSTFRSYNYAPLPRAAAAAPCDCERHSSALATGSHNHGIAIQRSSTGTCTSKLTS